MGRLFDQPFHATRHRHETHGVLPGGREVMYDSKGSPEASAKVDLVGSMGKPAASKAGPTGDGTVSRAKRTAATSSRSSNTAA
eukprot:2240337-Karenia_brevis.AAC.1